MDKIAADLFGLTATYLVKRLEGMLGESGLALEEGANEASRKDLKINQRAEIFIYGTDLTLRLQLFFNVDEQKSRIDHLYKEGANEARVNDFFNELANMTCGKVREEMVKQGVNAALSLPIAVATDDGRGRRASEILTFVRDAVLYKDKHALLASRVSLAIHNEEAFAQFNANAGNEADTAGEIELF